METRIQFTDYGIVGAIGAEGTEEVYRARDTTLDREMQFRVRDILQRRKQRARNRSECPNSPMSVRS